MTLHPTEAPPVPHRARLWVLGPRDSEAIEVARALRSLRERTAYAARAEGGILAREDAYHGMQAVTPGRREPVPLDDVRLLVLVECSVPVPARAIVVRADHHSPGDPGYALGPDRYMAGSSLGQVLSVLARQGALEAPPDALGTVEPADVPLPVGTWDMGVGRPRLVVARGWLHPPDRLLYVAAADHVPAAAHQGRCPGVDPVAFTRWLSESRAKGRNARRGDTFWTPEKVERGVQVALTILGRAPTLCLARDACVLDLREAQHHPDLHEAAFRAGAPYLTVARRGAPRLYLFGCGEGTRAGTRPVEVFMSEYAPGLGCTEVRGSPVRGFASAALPTPATP